MKSLLRLRKTKWTSGHNLCSPFFHFFSLQHSSRTYGRIEWGRTSFMHSLEAWFCASLHRFYTCVPQQIIYDLWFSPFFSWVVRLLLAGWLQPKILPVPAPLLESHSSWKMNVRRLVYWLQSFGRTIISAQQLHRAIFVFHLFLSYLGCVPIAISSEEKRIYVEKNEYFCKNILHADKLTNQMNFAKWKSLLLSIVMNTPNGIIITINQFRQAQKRNHIDHFRFIALVSNFKFEDYV